MHDGLLTMMLQSAAGLAVVLALFALLVWMLKRIQNQRYSTSGDNRMRIVQRFGIDTKHSIVELTHAGRSYLIGISPAGMNTIASYASDDAPNTAASSGDAPVTQP